MKIAMICLALLALKPSPSKADLWGGDLPLLTQIVFNTLHTLYELQKQSSLLNDSMDGIKDKIYRIETIADVVQPSDWDRWKNPQEALRRLRVIYQTLPPEYRSEKSDMIEQELSRAMNLIARVVPGARATFLSGKELEVRGAEASPGVAAKLTASGIGTLVAMEAQSQAIQSHITSLLAQMLADSNEKETRAVVARGAGFAGASSSLGTSQGWFSNHVKALRWK